MALNLALSLRHLRIRNYLIICEDDQSLNFLATHIPKIHLVRGMVKTESTNVDSAKFGSAEFRTLTFPRPLYIGAILAAGFNALWVDADVAFFRNPMDYIPVEGDVWFQDDVETTSDAVDDYVPRSSSRNVCICLIYMRPCAMSMRVLQTWEEAIRNRTSTTRNGWDQWLFNHVVLPKLQQDPEFQLRLLPVATFPSGGLYKLYKSNAAWIHANWRVGHANKVEFLQEQGAYRVAAGNKCYSNILSVMP
jgi:hypothetical protein